MNIIVDGKLISYQDEGQGRVILMLHGWGTRGQTFDELARDFVQRYRVVRLDFPGFGGSEKPDDNWGVAEYAQFVIQFLKKLNIADVEVIIAHSFGGRVALKGIGTGVLSPRKLVLVGSAGVRQQSNALKYSTYGYIAKVGKVVASLPGLSGTGQRLRRKLYAVAGSTDYLNTGAMRQIFVNVINEDLQEFAQKITIPTLMIWGENDTETPVAEAKVLHECIERSKLIIVPGAGHFVYTEAPEKVLQEINGFIV